MHLSGQVLEVLKLMYEWQRTISHLIEPCLSTERSSSGWPLKDHCDISKPIVVSFSVCQSLLPPSSVSRSSTRMTHSSWPTVPLQWRRAHLADAPGYRSTGLPRLPGLAVLYWSEFFFLLRLIWFNCQRANFGPNYLVMLGMNLSSLTASDPSGPAW